MKNVTVHSRLASTLGAVDWKGFSVSYDITDPGDVMHVDDEGNIILIRFIDPGDLKSMVYNGELFSTASEMLDLSPWSYIVILGEIEGIPVVKGSIITLQEMGVSVYGLRNLSMADEIQYIIQRDRKAVRADPKRLYVNATDSEAILMSLPGIGPSKVAILLSEYGTVYWALQALTDPGEKIPTITDDMKNRIREAFGLDDDMMITVVASSESLMSAQNSGENNG